MRPGCRRPFVSPARRDVDDAGLGREDDAIVFGDHVARGAQAVAIERRADEVAVGEGDRGGPSHGSVSGSSIRRRRADRRPSAGRAPTPRGSSSSSRAAASGPPSTSSSSMLSNCAESLLPGHDDGKSRSSGAAELGRLQQRAPRVHPVAVAAHGVDLAVVGDEAQRLRELPRGEGVGREARVHHPMADSMSGRRRSG
jgi:hypothetical protein